MIVLDSATGNILVHSYVSPYLVVCLAPSLLTLSSQVQFAGISGAEGRFLGWWNVMTQAAFSYIGTEIVAIAAGEAKNPRRNIPKAIKRVYIRILLFYILSIGLIGLNGAQGGGSM